jgi:hypothetical protein
VYTPIRNTEHKLTTEENPEDSVDSDGIPKHESAEDKIETISRLLNEIKNTKDKSKKDLKRRLQNRRSAIVSRLKK